VIEIARLHKELNATIVYVTHDQVEAMTLADKIVVMRGGIVEQVGAPLVLYDDPDNMFVAGFIGSPARVTRSWRFRWTLSSISAIPAMSTPIRCRASRSSSSRKSGGMAVVWARG
jgi:ABC-type sugar transport system ATPase subunit